MITSELVKQSIDYIMQHLEEEISIEDVADYCNYSKYYFCRMFKAETGESVYAFIKRLKMEQSALRLKHEREKPITEIGVDFGYSSSNYSWAFKKHHSVSPAEFRREINTTVAPYPFYPDKVDEFQSFEEYEKLIQIKQLDDFYVVYERHIGNYIELSEKWEEFTEKYRDYFTGTTLLMERFYDDPTVTSVEQCIFDLCMTVDENCPLPNVTKIQGGKFAVYQFDGFVQDIFIAVQGVFRIWLAKSGYEMDQRYGLDIYRKMDQENMRVVLDLCIPIK